MANLRMLNQTNPFWDWVTDMEQSRRERHAHFEDNGEGSSRTGPSQDQEAKTIPDDEDFQQPPDYDDDKTPEFDGPPPPHGPSHPGHHEPAGHPPAGPPPPFGPHGPPPHHHGHPGWAERGRHGHRGGRGGPHGQNWGGRGGFPPGHFGGRRGCGRRGWGGPPGWAQKFGFDKNGFDMEAVAQFLKENVGIDINAGKKDNDKDFVPPIDIFDTPSAYYIHVSLAGAKKQDLGVNWDPEAQEVHVMGVIHRPGDEEFLKTIAVDEREIGVFERRIKLGNKAQPASVDADGITAKMEDGILMIKVPKIEEFVEIKKVDIE